MEKYEAVIGLEVHAQLLTDSKIFATSSTAAGKEPNTLTDPVTLGLPGCLPVLNKRAVDFAIKLGLATNCEIQRVSVFARKHYFYPDLPKGYQISQYDKPLCTRGGIDIRVGGQKKHIGITRIHLEEDAGKNIHSDAAAVSLVDLNRAGV
ncbi:MAG TPA: Asp-tRNA(Asn)/Glu-tRNA(Gln) amidotransferase GatCAB subunit B, partial [Oligoflexia bacterium]|nr:Asp-tRNA(Asn)/Glu-tRNA(Gln) amidotransferase GatCAB subunit B [Oligoflexia bacterium]